MAETITRVASPRVGEARFENPLVGRLGPNATVGDDAWMMSAGSPDELARGGVLAFEAAGPRRRLFFDPAGTTAAIVTCGGLCPGLNNVIRSAVLELRHGYGVKSVLGLRYGYESLNPAFGHEPIDLTNEFVQDIHRRGGSILASSRGEQPVELMAETLVAMGVDILIAIGGDGTQRGAHALGGELARRGAKVAVVGVPKTIDNDVMYCDRSFGFTTAAAEAARVLVAGHEEAVGAFNGVAIVKLMGRHAGFIAAAATLAAQEANFCLVPERPFALDGERGLLALLEPRLKARRHALIAVAEGAGQHLFQNADAGTDKSGNRKLHDIGVHLRDRITAHFVSRQLQINVKYIDPSYVIRSVPTNVEDAVLCDQYGRAAVHAAMSGRTGMVVSQLRGAFVHVPSELITSGTKHLEPASMLWRAVLATTGQPDPIG
jgi:6-phosphofructokinase 1